MATFINSVTVGKDPEQLIEDMEGSERAIKFWNKEKDKRQLSQAEENLHYEKIQLEKSTAGVWIDFNASFMDIRKQFEEGKFIVAYYKANRVFSSIEPKHVEKFSLNQSIRLMKLQEVSLLNTYWI